MSIRRLTFVACDAPGCTAATLDRGVETGVKDGASYSAAAAARERAGRRWLTTARTGENGRRHKVDLCPVHR